MTRRARPGVGTNIMGRVSGEELEWQLHGLCRGDDPRKWFPDITQDFSREAKSICRTCPVMRECQVWGLTRHEEYGIWGGLTEEERIALWENRPHKVRKRRVHRKTLQAWGVA